MQPDNESDLSTLGVPVQRHEPPATLAEPGAGSNAPGTPAAPPARERVQNAWLAVLVVVGLAGYFAGLAAQLLDERFLTTPSDGGPPGLSPQDADLALLGGMVAGAVLALFLAWLALRPRIRRSRIVPVVLAAVVLGGAVALLLYASSDWVRSASVAAVLLALPIAVLAALWISGQLPRRGAGVLVAAVLLCGVAAAVLQWRHVATEDARLLAATGAPLSLPGGEQLTPPGWTVEDYAGPTAPQPEVPPHVRLSLRPSGARVTLAWLSFDPDCNSDALRQEQACTTLGETPHGPARGGWDPDAQASHMWVRVSEGVWTLDATRDLDAPAGTQPIPTREEALDLLRSLRPVDAATFAEAVERAGW